MEELFKELMEQMNSRFDKLEEKLETLEKGQGDIKEALKHNTTLMTENLTSIRKDLRMKVNDLEADIDLLFKEVEGVKRQSNKIEQRLGN